MSTATAWKPKPPIAAALGLFTSPLGMLYVQRPGFAAAYFGASILVGLAAFFSMWAVGSKIVEGLLFACGWLIAIVCAVHAFGIAKEMQATATRRWYSRWYSLVGILFATFLAVFFVRSFFFEPFRTPSQSMYPSLPAGSIIFVAKSGFGHYGTYGITPWKRPATEHINRGDIVLYRLVADPSINYLTRIVALPGDRIVYTDRRMTLNGQAVPTALGPRDGQYQFATERLDDRDIEVAWIPDRAARDYDEVVPPGHFVVFGDNRDNARDSRYLGFVPQENIVGRVAGVLRPRE